MYFNLNVIMEVRLIQFINDSILYYIASILNFHMDVEILEH